MSPQGLTNAAAILALQAPFLYALGLYFDVLRRHNFALAAAHALALGLIARAYAWPIIAFALAFAAVALLLVASEAALYRPLERAKRSPDQVLIASLGLNIVLEQILSAGFGDTIRFPSSGGGFGAWLLGLSPLRLAGPLSLATLTMLLLTLTRSEIGARIVALGENPTLFAILRLRPVLWRYAAIVAVAFVITVGAFAAAPVTGAYPAAGFPLVILGFATRLLGGPVHRPRFALAVAGVVSFDQLVAATLPGEWRTPLLFGGLLVLLSIRGLLPADSR